MIDKIHQSLKLITAPATEPISLDEARKQLRLTPEGSPESHPDDTLIEALILTARQHLDGKDGWLNRALITQTWELVMDRFPDHEIRIPLPPLQSIVNVFYADPEGVQQVVDSDDYAVDTDSEPGWIVPVDGVSWPETMETINAVRIRFTAGYSTVPAPIKHAMLLLLSHWYQQREPIVIGASVQTLPLSVEALLVPYQIVSFG